MEKPTVSVIVTTYNRETYLKETIQSILNQTYTDFELIVVDNYSNYDFFKVIEEFGDERVRPFQNKNNGIIAVNRNYGIKQACGNYLAFCDDDDVWMPEKLYKEVRAALKENVDVVYSDAFLYYGDSEPLALFRKYQINRVKDLVYNNPVILSSSLVRRNDDVAFDESQKFIAVEDHHLWLSLFARGFSFKHINEPLLNYRVSSSGLYNQNKKKRYLQYCMVLIDILINNPSIGYLLFFRRIVNLMFRYTCRSLFNDIGFVSAKQI